MLAVLWRRLVAAPWLTDGGSKQRQRCSVFSVFSRDTPRLVFLKFSNLPSYSYVLVFFFSSLGFSLLSVLPLSLICFFLFSPSPPSPLFSSLFFSFFFSPVCPPLPQRSWGSIYRAQGVALLWSMGSNRPVGHWARLPRFGPPPRFSGKCAVGGRPLCPVGGLQAREWPAKIQKKASFFPSSLLRDRGKKMNNVVQNDTVLLFFFFLNV